MKMNNYSSSNRSRTTFPSYRGPQHDRFHGPQDRGRGFYDQISQPRPSLSEGFTAFMSAKRKRPLDGEPLQRSTFQKYKPINQGSRRRESSQYNRNNQCSESVGPSFRNNTFARSSPLCSERDSFERKRVPFPNMLQHRRSPRSDSFDNSFIPLSASRQRDTSLNSYNMQMPSVDSELREKFRNHMRNEVEELSQEESRLLGKPSSPYQNDLAYSRRDGGLDQDRYGDLALLNSQQSFNRDYSIDCHGVAGHSETPTWGNERASYLHPSGRPFFPIITNSNGGDLFKDSCASRNSLSAIGEPGQVQVTLPSEHKSNISVKNHPFSPQSLLVCNMDVMNPLTPVGVKSDSSNRSAVSDVQVNNQSPIREVASKTKLKEKERRNLRKRLMRARKGCLKKHNFNTSVKNFPFSSQSLVCNMDVMNPLTPVGVKSDSSDRRAVSEVQGNDQSPMTEMACKKKLKRQQQKLRKRLEWAMKGSLIAGKKGAMKKTGKAGNSGATFHLKKSFINKGCRKRRCTASDTHEMTYKTPPLYNQAIYLVIVCKDNSREVTSTDADYITSVIDDRLLDGSIPTCRIRKTILQPSGFHIVCEDQETVDVLKTLVNVLPSPSNDHPGYHALSPGCMFPQRKFLAWFPGNRSPIDNLKLLGACNKGLDIKKIIIRAVIPGNGGNTLVLGVNTQLLEFLKAHSFKLFCGTYGCIQLKEPRKPKEEAAVKATPPPEDLPVEARDQPLEEDVTKKKPEPSSEALETTSDKVSSDTTSSQVEGSLSDFQSAPGNTTPSPEDLPVEARDQPLEEGITQKKSEPSLEALRTTSDKVSSATSSSQVEGSGSDFQSAPGKATPPPEDLPVKARDQPLEEGMTQKMSEPKPSLEALMMTSDMVSPATTSSQVEGSGSDFQSNLS